MSKNAPDPAIAAAPGQGPAAMRPAAAGLRLAALVLLLLAALWAFSGQASAYGLTLAALACLNITLAVSMQLTNGLTGLFSLGHPAFMMVGAYVAAVLGYPVARKSTMLFALPEPFVSWQMPFVLSVISAAVIVGLIAFLIGIIVLRLKGHYLAVATLGLIVIVQGLAINWQGLTRGGSGLSGIPRLTNIWWCAGLMMLVLLIVWRIKFSSLGRAMMATRENQLAAECIGVRTARVKLIAFVLGAIIAGVVGAFMAHLITVVTPRSYGIVLAFNLVAMVVLGGTGSIIGAVLAALVITLLGESLKPLEESMGLYGLSQMIVALMLVLVLRFRPAGLFGSGEPRWITRLFRPEMKQ
ncbi:branched-chain amino acid ABC transporter permease [Paracoccus sp. SCSIO 75233]|uniref:branched-chain amino acid ABC transporter permease n=1 Tax=Paracoccus sp. SCSIO 75233 TaxID=3017782 RepID=UPI0022EFE3F7|nr:branched-chain amino acid ABC transporter permease [Paracoccus sp. SCSIO 75233]WBU54133.1 branched-chain amino acid ABC transporter permease [Paracoccus sp. SCSIO 75233]